VAKFDLGVVEGIEFFSRGDEGEGMAGEIEGFLVGIIVDGGIDHGIVQEFGREGDHLLAPDIPPEIKHCKGKGIFNVH
jgi:hypothetical protein